MWPFNLLFKKKAEDSKPIQQVPKQKAERVFSYDELRLCTMGSTHWHTIDLNEPELVEKVHKHLMSAERIKIYCSEYGIEYSAILKDRGQVNGSASINCLAYFTFGIRRASVRYDFRLNSEVKKDPRCQAFDLWWKELVIPIIEEYKKDRNL